MKTTVNIIGVYPVQASQPAHLLEISINDSKGKFDISEFTQEVPNEPQELWQVPWDEKLLDASGEDIIADNYLLTTESSLWIGNLRLIFFFHYLDFSRPLITPFGPVDIPEERQKPERLIQINYVSPD